MATIVVFHVGETVGQSDDSTITNWDDEKESKDALMKRALLWSAGNWPESDGEYEAEVWIEDADGDVIASEEVMIAADGEQNFPG